MCSHYWQTTRVKLALVLATPWSRLLLIEKLIVVQLVRKLFFLRCMHHEGSFPRKEYPATGLCSE